MHFVQANSNGRLHDAREASVAPLNRGFLYGDAVYEVWRTCHGVVFGWTEHLRRLSASAEALHMGLPLHGDAMLAEVRRTVAAFRKASGHSGDCYIRLQVTRGGGAIGLAPELADKPDFTLLVQACPELDGKKLRHGLRLSVARSLRRNPVLALSPAWKTGNYLNNLLCLREALARGADEVLILNLKGEVTEASASNLAFVRDGEVVTPPMDAGILGGITRGFVLGPVSAAAGLKAREERIAPVDFAGMEECMILSTTKAVAPVAEIDDAKFKVGPETVTSRLSAAFGGFMRDYAARHPEFKV